MNITVTLIAQIIAFVLFIWLINRYLWGPMLAALESRRQQVADGLAAAEEGKKSLHAAQTEIQKMEEEARSKANAIIGGAERRATDIVEESKNVAREESEQIKRAAQSDLDQQTLQAKEALRQQVAALVIQGAERILSREVDAEAHRAALRELEKRI